MENRKIAALLLSVCLLLTACQSGDGMDIDLLPEPSETTTKASGTSEIVPQPDPVPDDEIPEEIIFTDPEIGGNAILSQDTLNGYTASLEVINIHSLPEDEEDAYVADKVYVRVTMPTGAELKLELINGFSPSKVQRVWADCAENALKIYELEEKGEKRYLLMVYGAYVKSRDAYKANFYNITAGREIYESQRFYNSTGDLAESYWWDVSDEFACKEGTTFTDSKVCCELNFSFERMEIDFTPTKGYSDEPAFCEPEIGGDVIFAEDSLGGYTTRLVLSDIVTLHSDDLNAYLAVGEITVTLTDKNGNSANSFISIAELGFGQIVGGVWADCTENAVKLYEIDWNGEKRYILRTYISLGTESGTYPSADPDLYCARFYVCDFDALEYGMLREYTVKGGSDTDFHISDSLVFKGENVLYDEKQQTKLVIDPDNFTIDIVQD